MPTTKRTLIIGVLIVLGTSAVLSAGDAVAPYQPYIPEDKGLDPEWIASLSLRGEPRVYQGDELNLIGMPCGGIGAGQLEISGKGTLGTWWIFNIAPPPNGGLGGYNGARYLRPAPIEKTVGNGFAIRIQGKDCEPVTLTLDGGDFDALEFRGEYPIASFDYRRKANDLPVEISSKVFNWYGSSADAAGWVAENVDRLYEQTELFRRTYHDTTLPYWLANRITMPVSTLACDNVKIWENGRMYAYEGVSFCLGTCGHVYNFAAAAARLFPELERSVRLQQDLALAFDPASGRVNFRGANGADPEHDWAYASDAQSGYVLKLYREHLMSPDNSFLEEVWPNVKRIIGYMIFHDTGTRGVEPNGVLEDLQTFWDPMWYGPNPYNNTLYLAALRAAEEMARLKGETALADRYHAILESGQAWMNERMWNGEYYVHLYPVGFHNPAGSNRARDVITPQQDQMNARDYIDAMLGGKSHYFVSTACDAQQTFGQNWAHQLGLGYILPAEHCRTAAASIFKYNWAPDIKAVYDLYPPRHRTLAASGEGALVNGAWPKARRQSFENIHDKDDIWTGLEYQAACDMINEGLLKEALIVLKAIDKRYDARKRNPWNEIEGAEHYSRAMHAWNVLLALSGYTYDGPAGSIGFAPKITPENFKSFFSGAEGWGSYEQSRTGKSQTAALHLAYGTLRVGTLAFDVPDGTNIGDTRVALAGGPDLKSVYEQRGSRVVIELNEPVTVQAGQTLRVEMR